MVKRNRVGSQAFERAVRAYEAGDRSSAEILLKQITLQQPEHASAHYVLGLLSLERGHNDAALSRFSRACDLEPNNAGFCTNQAEAARRLGRIDEAIATFERAISLDAARVEAHFNLGLALDARGELTRARAAFVAAVSLRPDQPMLLHRLAQAHLDLGELDLATERLLEVLASTRTISGRTPDWAACSFTWAGTTTPWPHSNMRSCSLPTTPPRTAR